MPNALFIEADPVEHREALLSLNTEYVSWVFREIEQSFSVTPQELLGLSASEYVASVLPKICGERPPHGVFYLLQVGDDFAGMCGLRSLRPGVAEIKRLYVRSEYRGMNLGDLALKRLLTDAGRFGYQSVCLDTGPFMKAAQRLYEANGFTDCAAYEGVEVPSEYHPRWRFMHRLVPEAHTGMPL